MASRCMRMVPRTRGLQGGGGGGGLLRQGGVGVGQMRRMMSDAQTEAFQTSPLELETLDTFLFRSKTLWMPPGARAVYGGQVVGQSLAASRKCLTDDKELHSLHSYFLKGGDPRTPILYRVRRLSVTNNFEMHHISGTQKGQIIFSLSASYHRKEKSELFHERAMPDAPDPNTLMSQEDRYRVLLEGPNLSDGVKQHILEFLKTPFPIDVREVDPLDLFHPKVTAPRKLVWMKANLSLDDADLNMHRCLAAFASDWGLASASLLPHGINFGTPGLKVSSLSHYLMGLWVLHSFFYYLLILSCVSLFIFIVNNLSGPCDVVSRAIQSR
jgi:acyl-CoA thioesterase II